MFLALLYEYVKSESLTSFFSQTTELTRRFDQKKDENHDCVSLLKIRCTNAAREALLKLN